MMGTTLALMLQVALLTPGADSFSEAYNTAKTQRIPMMVLVGAKWCPGCLTMKNATIPQLQQAGKLRHLAYAYVDLDRQPELARRMMQGDVVPQLILFVPDSEGWRRHQVTGAVPPAQVESMISGATQLQETDRRAMVRQVDRVVAGRHRRSR